MENLLFRGGCWGFPFPPVREGFVEKLWKGTNRFLFHIRCLNPVLNVENSVEKVKNYRFIPQDMGQNPTFFSGKVYILGKIRVLRAGFCTKFTPGGGKQRGRGVRFPSRTLASGRVFCGTMARPVRAYPGDRAPVPEWDLYSFRLRASAALRADAPLGQRDEGGVSNPLPTSLWTPIPTTTTRATALDPVSVDCTPPGATVPDSGRGLWPQSPCRRPRRSVLIWEFARDARAETLNRKPFHAASSARPQLQRYAPACPMR